MLDAFSIKVLRSGQDRSNKVGCQEGEGVRETFWDR